jgi:hypothetical protein
MQANVFGRVRNMSLPKGQGLLPLFEAVINSIDAIEDLKGDSTQGSIVVRILRQATLDLNLGRNGEDRIRRPILDFEIADDGIGFTEPNYEAFNEADTQAKAQRGGKGVGRFLWLRAFNKVEVESVFFDKSHLLRRFFEFSLATEQGITNHKVEPAEAGRAQGTTIRLLGFKSEFETHVPRSGQAIARRMVEHCLEYFILEKMPQVQVLDEDEEEAIPLEAVYQDLVANAERQTLDVSGATFNIVHYTLNAHLDLRHHISYCADKRVVKTERIAANRIPNLPPTLTSPQRSDSVIYAGYVVADYLDRHVNQQRTDFELPPDDGLFAPGEPRWAEISEAVLAASKQFLHAYTDQVRIDKEKRVREFVSTQAPEYRHIVTNHPDKLDAIPPEASDADLDTKLHEISRDVDTSLRKEAAQILASGVTSDDGAYEAKLDEFSRWWDEYNAAGKASLARYIVNRKMMLTVLENALKRQSSGRYSREEIVHRVLFPLRKTSDDITYDQHNLWILDEKLTYHQYLASDVSLSRVSSLEVDSASRPDLLIFFDRAIAVVDEGHPYGSGVVIFEFKRPLRDDYDENDNPIQQVLGYVDEIKSGRALTKDGRLINVPEHTPFYCYIVCDMTVRFKQQARFGSLRTTPDGSGYFGYNEEVGAYIEVISFDKLVSDAHKRNRVLFDKLNLPASLVAGG